MSDRTLIIIFVIWLGSNIVLPLFIRSLDRLYKEKIDKIVSTTFAGFSYTFNRIGQVVFIIFFLPGLTIAFPLTRIKNRKIQNFLIKYGLNKLRQILFDKNFTIINATRLMFIVQESDSPNK